MKFGVFILVETDVKIHSRIDSDFQIHPGPYSDTAYPDSVNRRSHLLWKTQTNLFDFEYDVAFEFLYVEMYAFCSCLYLLYVRGETERSRVPIGTEKPMPV